MFTAALNASQGKMALNLMRKFCLYTGIAIILACYGVHCNGGIVCISVFTSVTMVTVAIAAGFTPRSSWLVRYQLT